MKAPNVIRGDMKSDSPQGNFNLERHAHRRYNPLTQEWVLVLPDRWNRPWDHKKDNDAAKLRYEENCFLCPGNRRKNRNKRNPQYTDVFSFTNDFPALRPLTPRWRQRQNELMLAESVRGTCRVVCFSPRHDLTLAEMSVSQIRSVVDEWVKQLEELGTEYSWVQVFENKGMALSSTIEHPHGQIWACNWMPRNVGWEDISQKNYYKNHGRVLLLDYLNQELKFKKKSRIVETNRDWVMLVPYWASWTYEMLLIPRRHVGRLPELTPEEKKSLCEILRSSLIRYDNLVETSFPYAMGWHGAPTDGRKYPHWQLHAHFNSPVLHSVTTPRFMVGFEMLAELSRDMTPERAARQLREVQSIHYKQAGSNIDA